MELPVYQSNATPEERKLKLEWMAEQMRLIHHQEEIGVPVTKVKIRCGCMKLLPWWVMVKCLYCGIFYCPECAEGHFGMKRAPLDNAESA